MDEDSDSTVLSVSSEEGRPTILLAHYNFWFYVRTKLFSKAGCTKMPRNLTLFLYNCIFYHQTKEKFCFFEQLVESPNPPPPPAGVSVTKKKYVKSRCFKLYRAYSISFDSSNHSKFFWS